MKLLKTIAANQIDQLIRQAEASQFWLDYSSNTSRSVVISRLYINKLTGFGTSMVLPLLKSRKKKKKQVTNGWTSQCVAGLQRVETPLPSFCFTNWHEVVLWKLAVSSYLRFTSCQRPRCASRFQIIPQKYIDIWCLKKNSFIFQGHRIYHCSIYNG